MSKYDKITKEELEVLKKEIAKNSSFAEIGRILNLAPGTVKVLIKKNNIDMSNYSRIRKTGKKRKPTDYELNYIKDALANGKYKTEICKELNIYGQLLLSWCAQYDIDLKEYKKKASRKINFSDKQILEIKKMLSQGKTYKEIGNSYNISRNLVSKIISEYNLIQKKSADYSFSKEEIDAIKILANKNISKYKAAQCFSTTTNVLNSVLSDNNIKWNFNGKKMDEKIIFECLNIALSSRKDILNLVEWKDIEYIKENLLKKSLLEISKNLNKDLKTIKTFINVFTLYNDLNCDSIMCSEMKNSFIQDMENSELSNTYIGNKYGISLESIRTYRLENFGERAKLSSQSYSKTTIELELESILDTLDLCYFYHKKIVNYEIDYYIGQKIIIEVQGKYWHSENKTIKKYNPIEADNKKKKVLEENGYIVLQLKEDDIKNNKKNIAKLILKTYINKITR